MDCLADTGANIFLLIAIATGLSVVAALGIYLSSRYKRNFKYIASVLIFMIGVLGIGVLPSSSVNAASNNTQCGDSSKNVTPSSSSTSNNSDDDSTPTPVQKLWNVPFTSDFDWDDFTHYTVSEEAGYEPYTLSASGGTGTITGNRTDGNHGNHRDFFIYEPAGDSKDGEVRSLINIDNSGDMPQIGFVLRASNLGSNDHQAGVVAWTNVIFNGIGTDLAGIWRGFEVPNGTVYQNTAPNNSDAIRLPIASITADGTTATATTTIPIDNNPANTIIQINGVDPSINGTQYITVQDPHTLTFATTASGAWNGGSVDLVINSKRWIAARVIGNQLDVKHWLPGNPEPSWGDPYNSIHYTIPATLDNGDPSPTKGKFGILAAHLQDGKYVSVTNLQFKSLDP